MKQIHLTSMCFLAGALVGSWMPESASAESDIDAAPRVETSAPGVTLTLVAEHPQVMTPTGIDVDSRGNVWVVVSHTHFRPEDYDGPLHDEIVVLAPDGSRHVFYEATDATMDLELGADGWVYLAERDRILRVRDTDGDGVGDTEENIAVLDTEATYPHNGLSGLAWHPGGDLVFGLGENYWNPWTLTGTDQSQVAGTGEGGIFKCRPDGAGLRRIAKGFWNPFGITVRDDGTMFAAENDPGARPPCRLLHVVEGGEYGYQRRYGNAPFHPFVCWNGELRGTLPMLHSVGEAPCGIAPLGNGLIVPSWADHRIDYYPLLAHGASFQTRRETLVAGGDHFRPTCIAAASPTRFYLTDWVYGSYELHGMGRVWRLDIDPQKATDWLGDMEPRHPTKQAFLAGHLRTNGKSFQTWMLLSHAKSEDPFVVRATIDALSEHVQEFTPEKVDELPLEERLVVMLAIRKAAPKDERWVKHFWRHTNEAIRFETLRWIADEDLTQFLPEVEATLSDPSISYNIFEATLAAWNTLSGNPRAGVADVEMLMNRVQDESANATTRAYALRLLPPTHGKLTRSLCLDLRETNHPLVLTELVRTLAGNGKPFAREILAQVAGDPSIDSEIRADAISGLDPSSPKEQKILLSLAGSGQRVLREEALRSLRFADLDSASRDQIRKIGSRYPESGDLIQAVMDPKSIAKHRPPVEATTAWQSRLAAIDQAVDIEAGRRIFHHQKVGTCSKCHRYLGRGNVVGPDLSAASNEGDPHRLLRSLLQPSRDVDPQYYSWSILTEPGEVFTGIMLRKGGRSGKEFYRDASGQERAFNKSEIVQRKELTTSMMPDGLIDTLVDREIRDLLAFLDHGAIAKSYSQAKSPTQTMVSTGSETVDQKDFLGQWWLQFADGYGGWLSVDKVNEELTVEMLWRVGSARSVTAVRFQDGLLHFEGKRKGQISRFTAELDGDEITVTQTIDDVAADAEPKDSLVASGKRCPPMPPRPDLSQIQFGEPITLFNGRDLSGWKLQPADAKNGWSARDGELVNETPKTDFGAYGTHGNLRTEEVYGDFRLHIEFNVDAKRNSGIYLRGLYEAQVVDRDSPMQGIAGPGAIFGRIAPTKNAGRAGGQWQSYDLTLVDRHITVVLNGEKVIDNQPIAGCTGGALMGDVTSKGPIYLQGDHTSVRYRNIVLYPRIE